MRAAPPPLTVQHGGMNELTRWHRATRVFLARLLLVHGKDAPEVLRRMADELEWLAEVEHLEQCVEPEGLHHCSGGSFGGRSR